MYFYKFCGIAIATCLAVACAPPVPSNPVQNEKTPNTTTNTPTLGGDTDSHGCKASAGYQWSVVKDSCIRIFESGIRLDAQKEGLDKSLAAFVVFKSDADDQRAEVFMPDQSQSLIFDKVKGEDAGTWQHANFVLKQWRGMYILTDKADVTLYQGSAVK
jgi:hypothetical protein